MNRSRHTALSCTAMAAAALAAVLALTGCGGSSGPGTPSHDGSSGTPSKGSTPTSTPSSGSGVTTAAYFPVAVGNTWVYKESLGQAIGTSATGTVTSKMTAVTPTSGGELVTMTRTVTYPTPSTTKEILQFNSDGSIEVPLNQFGGGSVTIESGSVLWPGSSALSSGQAYHSRIVMKVVENGQSRTVTMPVTIQGEGTSSVTVPAGTYQATLIADTMTVSFDGYGFTITIHTWVANGVGPVKSQAYSTVRGQTLGLTTQELESFTKG
jgi:hypothetical protein